MVLPQLVVYEDELVSSTTTPWITFTALDHRSRLVCPQEHQITNTTVSFTNYSSNKDVCRYLSTL